MRARREGPDAIAQRQRTKLAGIVAHARAHSPYFLELYKDLPDRLEDPMLLPVTDKKQLMVRFDDWVTDRAVTIASVHAFIGNPAPIGERLLDTYTVLTTSGATGTLGIFVLDGRTMVVLWPRVCQPAGGDRIAKAFNPNSITAMPPPNARS